MSTAQTRRQKKLQHPIKPVENVALTTKGLQERKHNIKWEDPTVNCPSQETEETSTPTRPVDNVVITTKGLQDRNIHILDGMTVEN